MDHTIAIAELELSLAPLGNGIGVTTRFLVRGEDIDTRRGPFPTTLNRNALRVLSTNSALYGRVLSALFADPNASQAFAEARAAAEHADRRLLVRLYLAQAELHQLRWEMLLDPIGGAPLALDPERPLVRYLSGKGYQPETRLHRNDLRALVAVAAPADLGQYKLASIAAATELEHAQHALGKIPCMGLASGVAGAHCTFIALGEHLRVGCNILYLVSHGAFVGEEAWLYLEDEHGEVDRVPAEELVALVEGLGDRRPQLIVLASCESAGDSYANALAALGPRLAAAGVPAVLAMQGNVSMETMDAFSPVFFRELLRDGQVDRAAALARATLRGRADWWMPVVYTRLMDARIWEEAPKVTFYGDSILPDKYVERPALLADLRALMGSTNESQRRLPLALHGMGGTGKTVLARALCDDRAVRATFPDGIFWMTLGQQPHLVPMFRGWIERLGGTVSDNAPTRASLKAQLIGLLEDKACLIVADDVWRKTDAELLRIGGPRCQLLMTTRDAALAQELGAQIYLVPVMSADQSRELLRSWANDKYRIVTLYRVKSRSVVY